MSKKNDRFKVENELKASLTVFLSKLKKITIQLEKKMEREAARGGA
jgi:hypothetical protein